MTFGVKRLTLPKETCRLDEDGWIDVSTRLNVRLAMVMSSSGGKLETEAAQEFFEAFVHGWSIKAGGEVLPFARENMLKLPFEILTIIESDMDGLRKAATGYPLSGASTNGAQPAPSSSSVPAT